MSTWQSVGRCPYFVLKVQELSLKAHTQSTKFFKLTPPSSHPEQIDMETAPSYLSPPLPLRSTKAHPQARHGSHGVGILPPAVVPWLSSHFADRSLRLDCLPCSKSKFLSRSPVHAQAGDSAVPGRVPATCQEWSSTMTSGSVCRLH